MLKQLFYFTKREKSGIIFLLVLLAGIFIGKFFFSNPPNEWKESMQDNRSQDQTIAEKDSSENQRHYFDSGRRSPTRGYSPKREVSVEKKTYFDNQSRQTPYSRDTTTKIAAIPKYPAGTKVDINSIDTAGLMKVPGIGQSYAVRILKYRKLLGGYYSVEQLKEIYGMYEELYERIVPYFDISKDSIRTLPVNKASLEHLKSHPYINFYQAKAIVEMRKKRGSLKSIEELSLLEEFTAEDLEKMKNYLSFD